MSATVSRINVTGTGCICACGTDTEECLESMFSGKRNPVFDSRIKTGLKKIFPVFEIDREITGKLENPKGSSLTNVFLLHAVKEALKQSGISYLKNKKIGVSIGTTVGCTLNNEKFYIEYKNGEEPDILPVKNYLKSNPAKFISEYFGLTGPVSVISNACSSGTDAIGLAKLWIENGLCDAVIAGGTDELSRITYLGFSSMQITSEKPCMPFDEKRDGLNLGEGAGVLILENNASIKRSADSLAVLAGYGSSSDAYHPTAPHPEGTGLKRAVSQALKGVDLKEISFINAHGTSTPNNDSTEGKAISELYPENIPVVSTKSYTGHTLGAAGGIEAVFTVHSLINKLVPSTAGYSNYDKNCNIMPTAKNTSVTGKYAVSHSLAFGGNNSALLIRRAD
jgi:3-oxoacyl-[acyl-carrier-protein] synthase II